MDHSSEGNECHQLIPGIEETHDLPEFSSVVGWRVHIDEVFYLPAMARVKPL